MIRLADLAGVWQLSRRIIDHRAGHEGRLEGRCTWQPDADGLRQEEEGLLYIPTSPPLTARRRYLWRSEGAALCVYFEDGRPFHRLAPGQLADRHHCDPDLYDVHYDFSDWPDWTQSWRVTGPRKDTTIISRFHRGG